MFSQNWGISGYQRSSRWLAIKKVLVQPVEHWEMPSWERNISDHDIQHTNHNREMSFFDIVYHKPGWNMIKIIWQDIYQII